MGAVAVARALSALARMTAVVVAVAVVALACVDLAPGSPAERAALAAGLLPSGDRAPPDARAAIVRQVARARGLDRPWWRRAAAYVAGLAVLDLGGSWRDGRPVRELVAPALARTLALALAALAVALAVGLAAGAVAAARGGAAARAVAAIAAVAVAVPPAWLAIALLRALCYGRPFAWLPTGGLANGGAVLPVITLAFAPAFAVARYARAAVRDQLDAPWAVAARARGVPPARLVGVHALRAAGAPLSAAAVNAFVYLIGASVVVERAFGVRGLGGLIVDASARGDAPVVVGAAVATAAAIAAAATAGDAARRWLDPRQRRGRNGT
ncbi:MAG: ABC transporter permease subunit [Deltaproteobacteria bacterium]|nr:MAG: ABC transporter permease subunit [Deltaproteobacteria bacterium]